MTTQRSAASSASRTRCSTTITTLPSSAIRRQVSSTWRQTIGASPIDGSSRRRTLGSVRGRAAEGAHLLLAARERLDLLRQPLADDRERAGRALDAGLGLGGLEPRRLR